MSDPTAMRRHALPWILGVALLVLAGLAITRFLALRRELYAQVQAQVEAQIEDRVSTWEDGLLRLLESWQEQVAEAPDRAWWAEVQMRQREAWFDSVYVWKPRHAVMWRGRLRDEPAGFVYPVAPPSEESDAATRARCMTPPAGEIDPVRIAEIRLAQCAKDPLPVRMFVASQAASIFRKERGYEAALVALDRAGVEADLPLRSGIQRGLDPIRLAVLRLLRAECFLHLGRSEEGLELLADTGLEIASLDAPEVEHLMKYLPSIVRELRAHGHDARAEAVVQAGQQAERRLRAWGEIGERILPRPPQAASEGPRLVYDQYSHPPFLLFYGPARDGEIGVALQIDQPALLADLLADLRRYRDGIVILDASGTRLVGTEDPIAFQIPFSRTLTHLRVGVAQSTLDRQLERLDSQWFVPLVVVLVCVLMGGGAIAAQIRADRQQRLLLVRQREFTTRVTHELKTPLAGIRVMAENLEMGAFGTDEERDSMARSIVREVDRLTQRVEEILAVSKERKLPDPEPFDPEEAALEAIDHWGPRLERAGVRLHADLHPTDQVRGDADDVRDAVGCLLDNALKYHREDRPDPQVWLTLTQESGEVIFEVSDNGLGVPAEMREAIFERFVRVEGPNRGKSGGHGLGLSQVHEIARAHGGTVACLEGVAGGAKFVLRLPAARG